MSETASRATWRAAEGRRWALLAALALAASLALTPAARAQTTNYRSIGGATTQSGTTPTTGANVVNGSAIVNAQGAPDWVTQNWGRGDRITFDGGTNYYTVLSVNSQTQLTLTAPFAQTSGGKNYVIGRKFTSLAAWDQCIENRGGCTPYDPNPGSTNLVTGNRSEVGIVYKELANPQTGIIEIGSGTSPSVELTTDATHFVTLTADPGNRHSGIAGAAGAHAMIDGNNAGAKQGMLRIGASYTVIEWLELKRTCLSCGSTGAIKIDRNSAGAVSNLVFRNLLIHDHRQGITYGGAADPISLTLRNSIVYALSGDSPSAAIETESSGPTFSGVTVENVTIFGVASANTVAFKTGISALTIKNTISVNHVNAAGDLPGTCNAASTNNLSQFRNTGCGVSQGLMAPADTNQGSGNFVVFNSCTAGVGSCTLANGTVDLRLRTSTVNRAVDFGADLLATSLFRIDIEGQLRPGGASWDIGADELNGTTPVKLAGFSAQGYENAALVEWQTASELDNVGFHLYRGSSADGPWQRVNASLIPGLGSSPEGKAYSWTDTGLVNGATYFYRLEDVDRAGRATSHGPVSAVPLAGLPPPASGGGTSEQARPELGSGASFEAHGNPSDVSFRVLRRTARGLTLELRTGGFYSQVQPDGSVRLHVPGFFETSDPGWPRLPVKRAWVDAVAGRGARILSARASDLRSYPGLLPEPAGAPEAQARSDGTYRASFRRVRPKYPNGVFPAASARVIETAFQEDTKKAYLELAPLRLDGTRRRLVLARRIVVQIAFDGRVEEEAATGGAQGRKQPTPRGREEGTLLARLAARAAGLHAFSWESLDAASVASPQRGVFASSGLRLSRRGQPVAFHVEPRADRFGPGSTLYFVADGPETAYGNETVYELALAPGGVQMPTERFPRPGAQTQVSALLTRRGFEQNTNYLPALLNARDLWLWDYGMLAATGRDYSFSLSAPSATGDASLSVDLQGGSDTSGVDQDHRVRVYLNGLPLGEAVWDGLNPSHFEASVDASTLIDGTNTLRLENLDTTGAFDSVILLDRFAVQYPRALVAEAGRLDGRAAVSGLVRAAGLSARAVLLDVTGTTPSWLLPLATGAELAFAAEAGKSYLAISPEAVLRPEVRPATAATLRSASYQADWIVIAPKQLLPSAEPLVAQRESQGLRAIAVSLEQVQDEFGYGERSPQMLRDFLAHAYHHWAPPSVRYVLLLGDASYDPKGYFATASRHDLLPTPIVKSTFLWTASDPSLAAVNGDDAIPDLAIGRLSAGSLAEAEAAVQKILAFETSGQTLDGNAVLVADNPDKAGDFEANANDIATLLGSRAVNRIFLTQLGAQTRSAVLNAFDAGASLVSYVGHGSQALWASESILRSIDVALLQPQPRQPLMLTMTCSNGFFISPFLNGIAERFVLEREKGAIAAFSPSGLSVDDAAHLFHRALVSELQSRRHERLGDLVLAAQRDYADTGAFPELLSLYHLFADPALRIGPAAASSGQTP